MRQLSLEKEVSSFLIWIHKYLPMFIRPKHHKLFNRRLLLARIVTAHAGWILLKMSISKQDETCRYKIFGLELFMDIPGSWRLRFLRVFEWCSQFFLDVNVPKLWQLCYALGEKLKGNAFVSNKEMPLHNRQSPTYSNCFYSPLFSADFNLHPSMKPFLLNLSICNICTFSCLDILFLLARVRWTKVVH